MLIRSDHQDTASFIDELRRENERQRRAIEAGGLGIWEWDIAEDRITWSDGIYALHGLPKGNFGGQVADFASLVHPDDRADVQRTLDAALASGDVYTAEFRIVRPDGGIRWLSTRAA